MKNVLILSVGTRNKVIQYFRNAFAGRGKIVAADMSPLAPALYDADAYRVVPRITDPDYVDIVLDICRKERIDGILSLIDPELSLLAKNKERFEQAGVAVIGSDYECCERSLDKMRMCNWLSEHGYNAARSYTNKETFYADVDEGLIGYPVFVKPVKGSASININKVGDKKAIEFLFERHDGLMIQQFLNGHEIGADAYIDMVSGEVVSIFTKKKLLMRAGETDKSVSFKSEKLFDLLVEFISEAGYRGPIDVDIFEIGGEFYISEVNPRFGGGYPHAYGCGVDHMGLILNNLNGKPNANIIGNYEEGICMMKYNEICIKKIQTTVGGGISF